MKTVRVRGGRAKGRGKRMLVTCSDPLTVKAFKKTEDYRWGTSRRVQVRTDEGWRFYEIWDYQVMRRTDNYLVERAVLKPS